MSNGHPPVCDAACQKIILDGDLVGSLFRSIGTRLLSADIPIHHAHEVDESFDNARKAALEFVSAAREGMGDGPAAAVNIGHNLAEGCVALGNLFDETCEEIEAFVEEKALGNSKVILERLIEVENLAFVFMRVFLEKGVGYNGPWPKCLANS